MNLHPCVKKILCGLATVVLIALKNIIDGQVALLKAQIAAIQAQIAQYDLLVIPIQAAADAAQLVIDKVQRTNALIPLNLIAECTSLGDFNVNLTQSIDTAISIANEAVFEATRLVSFRDELNALVATINAQIDEFTEINVVIEECITESST